MAKRGRPKVDVGRGGGYRLRMTEEERTMLDVLSEKLGLTKADILRKGLKTLYNLEKYRSN